VLIVNCRNKKPRRRGGFCFGGTRVFAVSHGNRDCRVLPPLLPASCLPLRRLASRLSLRGFLPLRRCLFPPLRRCLLPSLWRCLFPPFWRCLLSSLWRCLFPPFWRCLLSSLWRCLPLCCLALRWLALCCLALRWLTLCCASFLCWHNGSG